MHLKQNPTALRETTITERSAAKPREMRASEMRKMIMRLVVE